MATMRGGRQAQQRSGFLVMASAAVMDRPLDLGPGERLAVDLPNGQRLTLWVADGALVVSGDDAVLVRPHAANKIDVR